MEIRRDGTRPTNRGSSDYVTGDVHIEPLLQATGSARVACTHVTFSPGARTAWHTHPLGQTLIVTSIRGLAQRDGGPFEDIHSGEAVWFPPGEKHWHGATAMSGMAHIAI